MVTCGVDGVKTMMPVESVKKVGQRVEPGSGESQILAQICRSSSGYQGRDDDFDDTQRLCENEGRQDEKDDHRHTAHKESVSHLKWSPVTHPDKTELKSRESLDSFVTSYGHHQRDDADFELETFERTEGGAFQTLAEVNADNAGDPQLAFTEPMQSISSFRTGGYDMADVFRTDDKTFPFSDHSEDFKDANNRGEDHMSFGVPDFHADRRLNELREHPTKQSIQASSESLGASMEPSVESSNPRIIHTEHGPALLLTTTAHAPSSGALCCRPRKFQRWSEEEDEILRYAVSSEDEAKPNWKKISRSYFANMRSPLQCKSRWQKSLKPGIQIGSWRQYEDDRIRHLRAEGYKWSEIAEQLPGRVGEHVRDRYVNFLDPDLKKSPWTKQEDKILFEQQKLQGNKWTAIAKLLPGRSENAVKNRWHNAKMTQRRRMRKHAAERSLVAQSIRARQHATKPESKNESGDEEATAI